MWFLASLIAEFVFEVMTNDVQDDGVCGNDAGAALDSNLIIMNHKVSQIEGSCVFFFFKSILSTLISHKGFKPSHFYFTFSSPLSF